MKPPVALRARARLRDVVAGKARFIGARVDPEGVQGVLSPIEGRLALGLRYGDLVCEERQRLTDRSAGSVATTLAGALIAKLLGDAPAESPRRPFIVSTFVDPLRIDEAVAAVFAPPPRGRARIIHFVHAHAVNLAAFDRELRETLAAADLLLPDGIGIRIAGLLLGTPVTDNVNGTDLLPELCRAAIAQRVPLVLVGGAPGVAETCARKLGEAHPGVEIAIATHGFLSDADVPALIEQIGALGPSVVLVGMGSPRQERWARKWLSGSTGATVVTVGGLFDFYSERIPRAPVFARELGVEWLFRLAQEPRRLALRYLLGNPLFLVLVAMQRAFGAALPPAATPRGRRAPP